MNTVIALLCIASVAWIAWVLIAMKRRGRTASKRQKEVDSEAMSRLGASLKHYSDKSSD
jgi:flagellar biosynthesis/type III secretory pathway M-ring protein FliF/YscJ